jgi:hypothetical protein
MKWEVDHHLTHRQLTLLVVGIIAWLIFVILWIMTDALIVGATPLAGNRGGCGRNNMVTVSCNVSDAGPGFVSGDCAWGYWFSRVSTRRTFRIGQIVTAYGCEGENQELYAPIRITR